MRWAVTPLLAVVAAAGPAMAADAPGGTVELSKAWTPATAQTGGDAPIYMTITNRGGAPDLLVRARCPANLADFTEKHATDRGEGGTSMREVKSLPIPPGATVTLAPGGDHLMLLHVREPLLEGQTFKCSLVFQAAGTVSVDVKVAPSEAKQAPQARGQTVSRARPGAKVALVFANAYDSRNPSTPGRLDGTARGQG